MNSRRHSIKEATDRDRCSRGESEGVVCLRDEFTAREPKFIRVTEQQADLREFTKASESNSYDAGGI